MPKNSLIDASTLTQWGQAILSFLIRALVIGAIAALDYVSQSLTNGAIQLPAPTITIPAAGLLISELDTWLVQWEKPSQPPSAGLTASAAAALPLPIPPLPPPPQGSTTPV